MHIPRISFVVFHIYSFHLSRVVVKIPHRFLEIVFMAVRYRIAKILCFLSDGEITDDDLCCWRNRKPDFFPSRHQVVVE